MSELRFNMVTGEWVVIATERAARPDSYAKSGKRETPEASPCPFCPGCEKMTPPEVMAYADGLREPDSVGWHLRVVPNKYPAFTPEKGIETKEGMFPKMPARGFHEVIINSPDHWMSLGEMKPEEVERVLRAYKDRILYLRLFDFVKYIQIIVNYGREAGSSIEHAHSQLFAIPMIPSLVRRELTRSRDWKRKTGKCLFCELMREEEKGDRLLLTNQSFVSFLTFAPRYPFESWVLPRDHLSRFEEIEEGDLHLLADLLNRLLNAYFHAFLDPPYNLILHTSPCQRDTQDYYHWHLEILPRLNTWGGFEMASGMIITTALPEEGAEFLRGHL